MRSFLILFFLFYSFVGSAQLDLMEKGELNSLKDQLFKGLSDLKSAEDGEEGYDPYQALLNLGDLYRSKRNYTKAIEYYQQALSYSNPAEGEERLFTLQNRLARVLYANAQYEEALDALEEVEEIGYIQEGYSGISNVELRARAHIQLEEFDEAVDVYELVFEDALINQNDTVLAIEALTNAAEITSLLQDYPKVLKILNRTEPLVQGCNTDPNVDIFIRKAQALQKMGRPKEAISEITKAEATGRLNTPEYFQMISQIYLNIGKEKEAISYIDKAIDIATVGNENEALKELYGLKAGIQQSNKSYKGSIESVRTLTSLVEKVRTEEILKESQRLRLQDYMRGVENEFRQVILQADLEASDRRETKLKEEAEKLKSERERLEKEKQDQRLALLKEREAVNVANLKTAELERKRIEQQALLLRRDKEALQRKIDIEQLEDQRITDSLQAAQVEREQTRQIELLELKETQAAFDAAQKERTLKKNRLVAILLGLGLLIAGGLWFNTRRLNKQLETKNIKIEEQRVQVEEERERAEQLLLNVLPKSIAEELKLNGVAAPEKYESASVLFTDFVGFTSISSALAPEEIIEELNQCFTEFDKIASRHRLEKIKTIGDSYMCAGGIPDANDTHPSDAVKAGQEMVAFMNKRNAEHKRNGKTLWPIRVGIHTGELVAGVVGSSKFAYDIWGDTVNVASRMERGAEHDSINVSEETYQLIKDHFDCQFRGEIDVKNKGKMGMYRVGY